MNERTSRMLLILFRVLFTGFLIWTIYFIFSNSLEIGAMSSAKSHAATEAINRFLSKAHMATISNDVVRKLAHFAEFTLLGFWYTLCLRVYTRHYIRHISWPLFLGLIIAVMDETLQHFVSARNSSVLDIWIDFSGVCGGLIAALCILILFSGFFALLGVGRPTHD